LTDEYRVALDRLNDIDKFINNYFITNGYI
jgi:hypothetical protein